MGGATGLHATLEQGCCENAILRLSIECRRPEPETVTFMGNNRAATKPCDDTEVASRMGGADGGREIKIRSKIKNGT